MSVLIKTQFESMENWAKASVSDFDGKIHYSSQGDVIVNDAEGIQETVTHLLRKNTCWSSNSLSGVKIDVDSVFMYAVQKSKYLVQRPSNDQTQVPKIYFSDKHPNLAPN